MFNVRLTGDHLYGMSVHLLMMSLMLSYFLPYLYHEMSDGIWD